MKSQSNSLLGRSRAVARLGVAAVLVLAAVGACSSDTTGSGTGGGAGGGTGGKGGASSAGGKGGTAQAGDTSPTGGSSVTSAGDTGNAGEGGQAEAGAPGNGAAVCGNGKVEPGEECDDGNAKNGDGCSATCKAKCEQCEQTNCAPSNPYQVDVGSAFGDCFGDTDIAKAPAQAGPAAGTPKGKLCQQVVDCVRRTGCANVNDPRDPISGCFCGAISGMDCMTEPKGQCIEEIAAAAESRSFGDVQQRAFDVSFAVGSAYSVLSTCDATVCQRACFQDKSATECDKCMLLDNTNSAPTGSGICVDVYGSCNFSGPYDIPDLRSCGPAADCALRTGCAANGVATCYGAGNGPCAQEFAAAAMSNDPASVTKWIAQLPPDRRMGVPPPLLETTDFLGCALRDCRAACFPGASGGTGGGGTGGGGTSGGGGTGGGGTTGTAGSSGAGGSGG